MGFMRLHVKASSAENGNRQLRFLKYFVSPFLSSMLWLDQLVIGMDTLWQDRYVTFPKVICFILYLNACKYCFITTEQCNAIPAIAYRDE